MRLGRHAHAALLVCFSAASVAGQSQTGELRLKVVDPKQAPVAAAVKLHSAANQYDGSFRTNDAGEFSAQLLPYGRYDLEVSRVGFATNTSTVDITSPLPAERMIRLEIAPTESSVTVTTDETLIDPDRAGSVNRIGLETIQERVSSIPGRSIQDLVNTQPGWLYEGNAVLHPRGSEYQTQFVVDGIPLTDNRSPSFGPAIEADDVQSLTIYTAGFPAEYGRKMGGVIEVGTLQDTQPGFHGQVVLSGGSFDSAGAFASGQYAWGKNFLSASAAGSMTDHYLNPVVPENFSNTGTLGDFSVRYQRNLTPTDRITLSLRHEISRYDIPNEMVQQAAGQRQNADNVETMGIVSYWHAFSPNVAADFRGMVRDNGSDFFSNNSSTPVEVFQHNYFREGYFSGSVSIHQGRHDIKAGVDSDNIFLHENFRYQITDPDQFDPDTPLTFVFRSNQPDLEQSAYVQDVIRLGAWTVSAGLRWDHYQLLVNRQAVDPRISVARYFKSADVIVHFSYDRVFQTPSNENILLSSSMAVESLDPENFLRLPVEPSEGNYYEAGVTKAFLGQFSIDANYYRRLVNNYADDDQIQNTTISFPIAFRKSVIYGAEAKVSVPNWGRFSGYASYSYMVGNAWFPVTGGLFLGDDASDALSQLQGHFPISQDQRNTLRGRMRCQLASRLWVAGSIQYDSGLPFEFVGDPETVLEEYGPAVLSRINFDRGRIKPAFQVNASMGADVYRSDRMTMRLQADGINLTNVLNVIDFGGLFSGNAIGPSRSYMLRLTTRF